MPFSEAIKLEVKQKAHFRCCHCEEIEFFDVHHLIPEHENGPSTIDNAIPLCGSCHKKYGENKQLRKQLRQKRDWWYKQCTERNNMPEISKLIQKEVDSQLRKLTKSTGIRFVKEGRTG
jgi:cytochrome c553